MNRRTAVAHLLIMAPGCAGACSVCASAEAERLFHPAVPWALIGTAYYLLLGWLLRPRSGSVFASIFTPSGIFWVAAGGLVVSGMMLGPLVPLLLLLVCARAAWDTWRVRGTLGRVHSAVFRAGTAVAVAALVATAYTSTRDGLARDAFDWAERWPGTALARRTVVDAGRTGDLPLLRRFLAGGDGFLAWRAAVELAAVGDPAVDAPLFESAMARLQQTQADKTWASMIEGELATLIKRARAP
ncbi:MAG: hypothetical protein SF028_09710 [Candidatus Sumerlaeia bacterium]|nr:hypothetical protein [Candidatus Sumerlaeia bacterium]